MDGLPDDLLVESVLCFFGLQDISRLQTVNRHYAQAMKNHAGPHRAKLYHQLMEKPPSHYHNILARRLSCWAHAPCSADFVLIPFSCLQGRADMTPLPWRASVAPSRQSVDLHYTTEDRQHTGSVQIRVICDTPHLFRVVGDYVWNDVHIPSSSWMCIVNKFMFSIYSPTSQLLFSGCQHIILQSWYSIISVLAEEFPVTLGGGFWTDEHTIITCVPDSTLSSGLRINYLRGNKFLVAHRCLITIWGLPHHAIEVLSKITLLTGDHTIINMPGITPIEWTFFQ